MDRSTRVAPLVRTLSAALGSVLLTLPAACSNGGFGAVQQASRADSSETDRRAQPSMRLRNDDPGAAKRTEQPAGPAPNGQAAPQAPLDASVSQPLLNPELHRLRRAALEQVLGREAPPGPYALPYAPPRPGPAAGDGVYDPHALGHFVPIENGSALEHFHDALARLASGKHADQKVRILAYGASHTQADVYTGYLRAYLQKRFGNGGQGFVLLGRVNRWYRTGDTAARHRGLIVRRARYRRDGQDEPLGLFGAALVGRRAGSFGEIITSEDSRNTRFELDYFEQPGGGAFSILLDGKTMAHVRTDSAKPKPARHAFETSPGRHRIRARLHGNGRVRLFGITAETATPGVVVDTLGIGGAQIAGSLSWHEDTWLEALRHRKPDLVMFAYGTNEIADEGHSQAAYERQLRAVLTRLRRGAPEASCVLIAPFDLPAIALSPAVTHQRLEEVVDAQRRIAKELGCGFWSGYAFMGRRGGMHRWVRAKPPLASPDHIHLTRVGYVYAGIAIGDALMQGYDRNTARRSDSPGLVTSSAEPR